MAQNQPDQNRGNPGNQQGNQGNWNNFRTKVKGKWNQLSDQDIDRVQGKRRDEVVETISTRVGGDRNTIGRDLDNIARESNYRFE